SPNLTSGAVFPETGGPKVWKKLSGGRVQMRVGLMTSTTGRLIDLLPPIMTGRSGDSPIWKGSGDVWKVGNVDADGGGSGEAAGAGSFGESSKNAWFIVGPPLEYTVRRFFELENSAFCFPCARHTYRIR